MQFDISISLRLLHIYEVVIDLLMVPEFYNQFVIVGIYTCINTYKGPGGSGLSGGTWRSNQTLRDKNSVIKTARLHRINTK